MALVKCEECGKEISNKAKSCPHCGYPVEQFFSNKDGFMEDVYSNITKISKKENFKVEINGKENVQKEKEIKSPIGWSKKDTFFCLGALLFCILVAIPMISIVEGIPIFSDNSTTNINDGGTTDNENKTELPLKIIESSNSFGGKLNITVEDFLAIYDDCYIALWGGSTVTDEARKLAAEYELYKHVDISNYVRYTSENEFNEYIDDFGVDFVGYVGDTSKLLTNTVMSFLTEKDDGQIFNIILTTKNENGWDRKMALNYYPIMMMLGTNTSTDAEEIFEECLNAYANGQAGCVYDNLVLSLSGDDNIVQLHIYFCSDEGINKIDNLHKVVLNGVVDNNA